MSAATITAPIRHEPELSGQTIVVIGGRLLLMGRTCGRHERGTPEFPSTTSKTG